MIHIVFPFSSNFLLFVFSFGNLSFFLSSEKSFSFVIENAIMLIREGGLVMKIKLYTSPLHIYLYFWPAKL